MQRLRITFGRSGGAKYLSHLEMMKTWERVFRRAGWKVAHSQGFNPHPRIFFAAPLAVGVAAEADIVEVHLDTPVDVSAARSQLAEHLPPGLGVGAVEELTADAPQPQKAIRAADYVALCPPSAQKPEVEAALERVTAAASIPRLRQKDRKAVEYDLRPLIYSLEIAGSDPVTIRMRLKSDAQGAGRADEVLRELGMDPAECSITRTGLVLEG